MDSGRRKGRVSAWRDGETKEGKEKSDERGERPSRTDPDVGGPDLALAGMEVVFKEGSGDVLLKFGDLRERGRGWSEFAGLCGRERKTY